MGQILAGMGFGIGALVSLQEGQNIFRAILNGFIYSAVFWGAGWLINNWKNRL